jgi:hypothetical protein
VAAAAGVARGARAFVFFLWFRQADLNWRLSMTVLQVLKVVAAVGTIATGLVSLVWPLSVTGFTGLSAEGGRGVTEIRAVLGAFFIALGAAPLILRTPETYRMLGIAYLVVAAVRAVSMFVDRSVVQSNLISLAVEVVFGVILVW